MNAVLDCECFVDGTIGALDTCNSKTGQCACKPSVKGRTCNDCKDGSFDLYGGSLFGCKDCGCDIGGSVNGVCNKRSGQCKCHPRVAGRTCSHPLTTHVCYKRTFVVIWRYIYFDIWIYSTSRHYSNTPSNTNMVTQYLVPLCAINSMNLNSLTSANVVTLNSRPSNRKSAMKWTSSDHRFIALLFVLSIHRMRTL